MHDLRAFVSNFPAAGTAARIDESGNRIEFLRLDLEGYQVEVQQVFVPRPRKLKEFRGQKISTTEILVRGVKEKHLSKALKMCDRLCWLMSLAGLTMACRYAYEYPDGMAKNKGPVIGALNIFRPTLELANAQAIETYLQNGYLPFKKYEKRRDLRAVVSYLANVHSHEMPLQLKLIGCFVVLESLKATYASEQSIPFINGAFRKGQNRKSPVYKFEELLMLMFQEYGVKYGLKRIIKLRNDIIHTGYTTRPFKQQLKQFDRVNDILRVYLLKLLEYEGDYPVFSKANRKYREL